MEDLFDAETAAAMRRRIEAVGAANERQWGAMSVAQMMEHCARGMEMASGTRAVKRPLLWRFVGPMIKPMVLKDGEPMRAGSPTMAEFRIKDEGEVEAGRERLLETFDRFVSGGPAGCSKAPHPFFGKLTAEEWSKLMHKHLDHHLRQFGA